MRYLIRNGKAKVAHLFEDGDTLCRLYSTGGMKKKRYQEYATDRGLSICVMCQNVDGTVLARMASRKQRPELTKLIKEQEKETPRKRLVPLKKHQFDSRSVMRTSHSI
jgi:spore germination cell wall hydrolase CwlJ-like protein